MWYNGRQGSSESVPIRTIPSRTIESFNAARLLEITSHKKVSTMDGHRPDITGKNAERYARAQRRPISSIPSRNAIYQYRASSVKKTTGKNICALCSQRPHKPSKVVYRNS